MTLVCFCDSVNVHNTCYPQQQVYIDSLTAPTPTATALINGTNAYSNCIDQQHQRLQQLHRSTAPTPTATASIDTIAKLIRSQIHSSDPSIQSIDTIAKLKNARRCGRLLRELITIDNQYDQFP
mmetsp:Transcript_20157/g.56036  ORF Transcript_20157/g.56036 Transcript_20157/m.56036 type:complete len:124 (-) Transcript_20157:952-1323(-)